MPHLMAAGAITYFRVSVRFYAGTYQTSNVGGQRASCTRSAECAVKRLAQKIYAGKFEPRIEQEPSDAKQWRIHFPEVY